MAVKVCNVNIVIGRFVPVEQAAVASQFVMLDMLFTL